MHTAKTLGWAGGGDPTFDGFQPPKVLWGRSRPSRRKRDRVFAACRSRRMQFVMQDVIQNQQGGRKTQHGNHQGTTQTTKIGDSPGPCRRISENATRPICEVHRFNSVICHHGGAESPVQTRRRIQSLARPTARQRKDSRTKGRRSQRDRVTRMKGAPT
jgi:hypothetical protein